MPSQEGLTKRQRVLAEFGDLALRSNDLQEVLTEACRLVRRALDTEFAKILQIENAGEELLVRAGVGWPQGVVGTVRLPMTEHSSEAFAIRQARPVVTQDIGREDRFSYPPFMLEAGVVAIVNVPIFLPGGLAYGLLQVDSRRPREFDDDDVQFLRTYAAVLGPVIDRLFKAMDLDRTKRLMDELQHRIKNNFATVAAAYSSESSNKLTFFVAEREDRVVGV